MTHRLTFRFTFALSLLVLISFTACAPQQSLISGFDDRDNVGGLLVQTRNEGHLLFHENEWRLSMRGIQGRADITTPDGVSFTADTTLSYFQAITAEATGRSTTMSQFLLTILGVILVIGLAAIILYAAFLATDR